MDTREKTRNAKSSDCVMKQKSDKDKIKDLMLKIKTKKLFESDFSVSIIDCFIQENFRPLSINDIIRILESGKLKNANKKFNLRNDVMNSLKDNIVFRPGRKKNKYELNLDKTVNYLSSFFDTSVNSNTNSKRSKKSNSTLEKDYIRTSPIFNFPENQNSTAYLISEENLQKFSNSNIDDTSFTFGEQSLKKMNKNNKQDEEETIMDFTDDEKKINKNKITNEEFQQLEIKTKEKYIDKFEDIFDKGKYLVNLKENVDEFFKLYKKNNKNKADFPELEKKINNIYSLISELQVKKKSFNGLSSLFNEGKRDLLSMCLTIEPQYNLIKFLLKYNFIPEKIISIEKEIFKDCYTRFQKMFNKLPKNYEETKLTEKKIKEIINKIKLGLNGICDEFLEKKKEMYKDFYEKVTNISNNEITHIKVNINESIKYFNCFSNEFDKYFSEIENSK